MSAWCERFGQQTVCGVLVEVLEALGPGLVEGSLLIGGGP